MNSAPTERWHVSDDCKATLLLCHEFGGGRMQGDAKPLSIWEYGQLVRFLQELNARPSAVLQSETAEPILAKLPVELPAARVRSLLARGLSLSLALETWRSRGIWVISRADPAYPTRLKERFRLEAPPVLFGVGNPSFLDAGGLGVFGSRDVDEEGAKFSFEIGRRCASEGITVLSGCARGVDWSAMSGCLENNGRAIGVIAERLDKSALSSLYRDPIRQQRLVLISMFAPEAPFWAAHAKGRDKYTYALSDHALVVSSEKNKGGTWAGATEQLNRLRHVPVFVRSEGHLPVGNPVLLSMGGLPFPAHQKIASLSDFLANSSDKISSPIETADSAKVEEQREIFSELPSPSPAKKSSKKKKKVTSVDSPADQLAKFAVNLLAQHLPASVDMQKNAETLGVSVDQLRRWLAHGSRKGSG